MPTTSLDLAKHYWVDDVASAGTAGTRLNNILESLAKGQTLTDASKHFLTVRGLLTLVGVASGEILEEQFNALARAEREGRISAARVQEQAMELQRQADLAAMEVQRQNDLAAGE